MPYIKKIQDITGTQYKIKDEELRIMTASSEASNVSSTQYDAGELFSINGTLYKATDDIDIGDSIQENVNCERTTIGNEIYAINNRLDSIIDGNEVSY